MIDLLPLLGKQVWIQAGRIVLYGTLVMYDTRFGDTDDSDTQRGLHFSVVDQVTVNVCHAIDFDAGRVKHIGEMNGEPIITLDVPL